MKCKCVHCSQHIEFESQNIGQAIECPGCGMETILFDPPKMEIPKVEKPIINPTRILKPWEITKEYLEYIRQHTCYKNLRDLIWIITWLSFAGYLIMIVIGCVMVSESNGHQGIFIIAGGFAGASMSLVLGWLSYLIIDVADSVLKENSKQ